MTSHSANSSDNDKVNSKNHNKKSNSPRSKKKPNSLRSPTTMLPQSSSVSGNESIGLNSLSGKEKPHHKSYAGLASKSIKCIWEQFDTSETEVNPEVYGRLAEDATYKLWELCNNLKTYTRHSGGKLTVDLTNEVLKDADVPPVIGAGINNWDQIDYDGTYYFHFDEVLELRDEYNKEVTLNQPGPLNLSSNWFANKKSVKNLEGLSTSLSNAIFTGNDAAFKYAIQATTINPYIGCILQPLLNKILSMIVITYTDETLDRAIKFLSAIVYNYNSREATANYQLLHMSQLLTCLILGPLDLNQHLSDEQKKMEEKINQIAGELEQSPTTNNIFQLDGIQSHIKTTSLSDQIDFVKQEGMYYEDMKEIEPTTSYSTIDDFQAVMQIMRNEGFDKMDGVACKKPKIKHELKDSAYEFEVGTSYEVQDFIPVQQPTFVPVSDDKIFQDTKLSLIETPGKYSSLVTRMCDDRFVDDLCSLVGNMAANWGYFEGEIIFILTKRLEIYFNLMEISNTPDYQWLMRIVRLLSVLGEYAFRELTVYFDKIDPLVVPECLQCHLNFPAIFLRGREDIFFHEYLNDLCGDGLLPFMLYFSNYTLKKSQTKRKSVEPTFKIAPKLVLRTINKIENKISTLDDAFPERASLKRRNIGFKFAGCCPVILKSKLPSPADVIQQADLLTNFNNKVVICKRKLLKSITDAKSIEQKSDFRWLRIS
ncbi:uncharacterized protein LOC119081691 [Bradysia coprophila]|uniref:uncharacterized protein LOC119081691 n=1 Tax=Bradysia coprophila TaxID=38358 RepID=UPI00187DA210|nr:uncharacterized protein LOC119081691 [Bradysia coprophila]